LRRAEKRFEKCTSCGRSKPKYVKTGYGNWIKWKPPKPLNNVKTKCDSAEKRKKALKAEKAQVQLKRQVKALTAKNKELQARLQLQEQGLAEVKKEETPAKDINRNMKLEKPAVLTATTLGDLQDVHGYDQQKSDAMEQRIKKL